MRKWTDLIINVPDYPKEGIQFKDITQVLQNADSFEFVIKALADEIRKLADFSSEKTIIAGIEARGFVLASALAFHLGCGLLMIRKKGKLPRKTISYSYDLEYGQNTIEAHIQDLQQIEERKEKLIIVDDLLATGGTVQAAINLIKNFDISVLALAFLIELSDLNARDKFADLDIISLEKM